MRKRYIRVVSHWVIMSVVILFPIIMVILSSFGLGNTQETINNWIVEFISLDVNSWYSTLLNTIGISFTDNSVMAVMYIFPLYVIWVYVLDLLTDIFLVIVKLGHTFLERLGADNE